MYFPSATGTPMNNINSHLAFIGANMLVYEVMLIGNGSRWIPI